MLFSKHRLKITYSGSQLVEVEARTMSEMRELLEIAREHEKHRAHAGVNHYFHADISPLNAREAAKLVAEHLKTMPSGTTS